jgi:hypothetical protein
MSYRATLWKIAHANLVTNEERLGGYAWIATIILNVVDVWNSQPATHII